MTRIARVLTVATLGAAALGAHGVATPQSTFACSCAPTTMADFVGLPDVVIVSGTIADLRETATGQQQGVFTIARVYQGSLPGPRMPVLGGGGGDCTRNLEGLANVITVAQVGEDGFLVPGLCAPFGDLSTPEGQRLLAEVNATFGVAPSPPEGGDEIAAPVQLAALLLAVAAGAIALFGAIVMITRRGPRPRGTQP